LKFESWNSIVAKKKRHTEAEIAAKLHRASALAADGRTQIEIARDLGISIMTYHRWRKALPQRPQPVADSPSASVMLGPETASRHTADLQTENARLRKLVTDLLLEKMRLEEELTRPPTSPKRVRR
jgi:putative transposase